MNKYSVVYAPQAKIAAKRIVNYMRGVLLSNQAADNFIKKLKAKEEAIAKNPYGYQVEYFGKHRYHKATINQYIIAFRVDQNTHTVHIIAIGHSKQKRRNILKPLE